MKRRTGKGHKLLAAGTATLIAEPALAMAHQGGIGVIVGLAVGAAAYALIDDVEMVTGKSLSLPASRRSAAVATPKTRGKPQLFHRLLVGKSVREEEDMAPAELEVADDDPEDEYVPLLELGIDLCPHVDSVFSRRAAILGMSGAGKSNLVSVAVEELGQFPASLIVFDLKGEYVPLCARPYLTNPCLLNASNVTPETAHAFALQIMRERLHVIVDVSSYASDADAALVMTGLVAGVVRYQKARPNDERLPCTLVLEEAHYWLPQDMSQSTLRGIKNTNDAKGQTLLAYLQQAFFYVATQGRSYGIGLIVATQRPANVDNRLISQAEWRFLLKAMEPADLARYREHGIPDGVAPRLDPKQGEAYVIGPNGERGVYRIRRRHSPDEAKSPGLANIRNVDRGGRSSPHSRSPQEEAFERGNGWGNIARENAGNDENAPGKPFPRPEHGREYSPALGNVGNAAGNAGEELDYTQAEETRVLLAYAELSREYGERPVPRTAIRDRLEWGNRQFTRIIKPVCDKHGIAMRES